ncbi:MaoC family dehydratase [Crossiella sp. CA-258035]|uniref:MaoC family dehydratase n=1 Tax=Crossiella sp. CA-258035 TaxID=2981138 RepID=UPI0024BD1A62|nr:MaoC family dehydratase [Crossiella sp. CA-258035]WHT17571.1 MaoC family dehydratase [Crossiella sp. CA-258035]
MTAMQLKPDELAELAGTSLGYSGWRQITQDRITRFAEATDDHQWIHLDPEQCAQGPYGRPIAHGFLILSLLPAFIGEVFEVAGVALSLNYRVDKVRFRKPVAAGEWIRAKVGIGAVRQRPHGYLEVTATVSVELDDGSVACTAEQTSLYPGTG